MKEELLLRNRVMGVLIRDARLTAGKTQETCANFLGMPVSRLSDIEYGERGISLPELEGFAYLVDVPLDHFLGTELLEAPEEETLPVEALLPMRHKVVGVMLRQARLAAGRSQAECAEAIGVPDSRISSYEYGSMPIPLAELEALAAYLDVSLETFIDAENNPISKRMSQDRALEQLRHLPEELHAFMLDPLNADYLRTALRLSKVPADQLRGIAETLLEITY